VVFDLLDDQIHHTRYGFDNIENTDSFDVDTQKAGFIHQSCKATVTA